MDLNKQISDRIVETDMQRRPAVNAIVFDSPLLASIVKNQNFEQYIIPLHSFLTCISFYGDTQVNSSRQTTLKPAERRSTNVRISATSIARTLPYFPIPISCLEE